MRWPSSSSCFFLGLVPQYDVRSYVPAWLLHILSPLTHISNRIVAHTQVLKTLLLQLETCHLGTQQNSTSLLRGVLYMHKHVRLLSSGHLLACYLCPSI